MKRISIVAVLVGCLALAIGPAAALARHGRSDQRVSGTVQSFTNGTLTILTADGGMVSGQVTRRTEIQCERTSGNGAHSSRLARMADHGGSGDNPGSVDQGDRNDNDAAEHAGNDVGDQNDNDNEAADGNDNEAANANDNEAANGNDNEAANDNDNDAANENDDDADDQGQPATPACGTASLTSGAVVNRARLRDRHHSTTGTLAFDQIKLAA